MKPGGMRKSIGYLLSIGGFGALVYTGVNYINNSESFGFMGADVVISSGDPVPVLLSAILLLLGIFLVRTKS